MKDTVLFLKIAFLGIITLACFIFSFVSLYFLISETSDFALEKYLSFNSSDRGRIKFLLGTNMLFILVSLLISFFSFKELRKTYIQLCQ